MRKTFLILCIFPVVCVLSGIPAPASSIWARAKDPVLAAVNGEQITLSQLKPLVDEYLQRSRKSSVKPEERLQILNGLIKRRLILQQREAEELRADEKIAVKVKDFEDRLVVAAFLEKHVGQKLTATDEEIQGFYQQNIQKFSAPPKATARHILMRTREKAEQVLAELHNGADFGRMAKEHSIDLPMALEGGQMGTIEKGKTLPELEKALFILEVGEISDVVESRFGFHILTVDEIIAAQSMPIEEVRDGIRNAIIRQKETRAFEEMGANLEKTAEIQIYEANLQESE